jgi:hypothetical protein
MAQHTPGPWHIAQGSPLTITSQSSHICTVSGSKSNLSSMADANLIAAAPSLLVALERLMVHHKVVTATDKEVMYEAMQACRRARGEAA